jgi:hypothetical protein
MQERKLLYLDLPAIMDEVNAIAQSIANNYSISGG